MEAPKSIRFMWTDSWCDVAARKNPLRWTRCDSSLALSEKLEAENHDRPLRIYADRQDGHTERQFKDVSSALQWLQKEFPRGDAAQSKLTSTNSVINSNFESGANTQSSSEDNHHASQPCHGALVPQLRYMWADPRLFGRESFHSLAHANPLRWSLSKSPQEMLKSLELAQMYYLDRPVKLEVESRDEHTLKTFNTMQDAITWVRETFNIEEQVQSQEEPHRCVICLESEVTVMLMPCRHAVLCDGCAEDLFARRAAIQSCPICRTPINNHARGHFATDYVDLVQAMETRMERTTASVYDGMYNHIKPLMLTGALLGTGAAVCFVIAPPVAPALAGAAFAVGYVPWFATTCAHFEREDLQAQHQLTAQSYFSSEDFANPLKLITKVVVMAVAAPLAAVAFFIPYGLYRGVLKPASAALLQGLVRLAAFVHVYAARPTSEALKRVGDCLLGLLQSFGRHSRDLSFMLGDMLVAAGSNALDLVKAIGSFLHDYAWTPCLLAAQRCGELVSHCASAGYNNAIVPAARAIRIGIATLARSTHDHAMVPMGRAMRRLARAIGQGAATVYEYVLTPCGRFVVLVVGKIRDCISAGAQAAYSYFLIPCGRAAWTALRMLGRGLLSGLDFVIANLLIPAGEGTLKALRMLANGVVCAAEFAYSNAVVPIGYTVVSVLQALANGLRLGAATTYTYVVRPCGTALFYIAGGTLYAGSLLARGLVSAATQIYSSALVPMASTIYVYALAPGGRAIYSLGVLTATGVAIAGTNVAQCATMAARTVYVYVLLPGGEVAILVCSNVGEAARACGRELSAALGAAGTAVRQACLQTREALTSIHF